MSVKYVLCVAELEIFLKYLFLKIAIVLIKKYFKFITRGMLKAEYCSILVVYFYNFMLINIKLHLFILLYLLHEDLKES